MSPLLLFTALLATGPADGIYIMPSTWKADLLSRLEVERPRIRWVTTASTARLVVNLSPAPEGVYLDIRHRSGAQAVRRLLDMHEHPDPALRVATLLILRTIDRPDPDSEKDTTPAPTSVALVRPGRTAPRTVPQRPAPVPWVRPGRTAPRTTPQRPASAPLIQPERTATAPKRHAPVPWVRPGQTAPRTVPQRPTSAPLVRPERTPSQRKTAIPPYQPLSFRSVTASPSPSSHSNPPETVTAAQDVAIPTDGWVLDLGVGTRLVPGQNEPQLTLRSGLTTRYGPVRMGGSLLVSGFCCAFGDAVRGRQLEVSVLVEAGTRVFEIGNFEVETGAAGGVRYSRLTAQSQVFAGPGPEETTASFGFEGRAYATARLRLDRSIALSWATGLLVRTPQQTARLPEGYMGEPIKIAWWAPWAEFRLEFSLF